MHRAPRRLQPRRALPVFEQESNVIAGQTMGIVWIVAVVAELTGGRIQSIKPLRVASHSIPVPILGDMFHFA
jgi:hypothetical protein